MCVFDVPQARIRSGIIDVRSLHQNSRPVRYPRPSRRVTPPHKHAFPRFTGLTSILERQGWEVHTQLEDPSSYGLTPLEDLAGTPEEKDAEILRQLKAHDAATCETKRALILKTSHIGGHKFAGNCIVRSFLYCLIGDRV